MGTVIVCGSGEADAAIRALLPQAELIETAAAHVEARSAVVVLGRSGRLRVNSALGVIVNSDEPPEDIPEGVQLITVGHGAKNTVSITSCTPERHTLSLNRAVQTLAGICEPFELPFTAAEELTENGCMAAFAAGILLGEISL